MKRETIYLRAVIEDGVKRVIDQHGREVGAVRKMEISAAAGEADCITLVIEERDEDGNMIANGGHH